MSTNMTNQEFREAAKERLSIFPGRIFHIRGHIQEKKIYMGDEFETK